MAPGIKKTKRTTRARAKAGLKKTCPLKHQNLPPGTSSPMDISYSVEEQLNEAEFITLLRSCSLGARRPLHQPERIKTMCSNANLVVTARLNGKLVGVARSLSDFGYCTYLSDLAVSEEVQKQGIGRELIKRTREAAPDATLILLSAPAAKQYYPKLGMQKHEAAFILNAGEELK